MKCLHRSDKKGQAKFYAVFPVVLCWPRWKGWIQVIILHVMLNISLLTLHNWRLAKCLARQFTSKSLLRYRCKRLLTNVEKKRKTASGFHKNYLCGQEQKSLSGCREAGNSERTFRGLFRRSQGHGALSSLFGEKEENFFHYVAQACLEKSTSVKPACMVSIDKQLDWRMLGNITWNECHVLKCYFETFGTFIGEVMLFLFPHLEKRINISSGWLQNYYVQKCFLMSKPEKGTTNKKQLSVNPWVLTFVADLVGQDWRGKC